MSRTYTAIIKMMDDDSIKRVNFTAEFDIKDRAEYNARVHYGLYMDYEQALNAIADDLVRAQHPEIGIYTIKAVG